MGVTDHYARKIARTVGLAAVDIDDLRQDLLVEVLRRTGFYDPGRAALSTFIEMITGHAAGDLASERVTERQVSGRSLDDPSVRRDPSSVPLGHLLPADRGIAAFWAGWPDAFTTLEERIDIERFVQALPEDLRRLCYLLQTETPLVAQRLSGRLQAEFYRQVQDLRMRLRAIGLGRGTP